VADRKAIGILGGGQLGLMLAEALDRLGRDTVILEPDPDAPCATRRGNVLARPFDEPQALEELFRRVTVATFDSENIPSAPLARYVAQLAPSLNVLQVSQDRAREKTFLAARGFRPVAFRVVPAGEDVRAAVNSFGLPAIAKSALGGYDGKGQHRLATEADVAALPETAPGGWVLEEVLTLTAEVSCIVASDGQSAFTFPVFENLHRHHILDLTVLPARVPAEVRDEARRVALGIAKALEVRGLLTVEFFVGSGRDGVPRLYVNELAPRVHNSGHLTRQACTLSQFDALARILAGVPVHEPKLHSGGWCMGQLLGDVWLAQGRDGGPLDLSAWRHFPDVLDVYVYGKRKARPNRKMGHFVVRADSADEAQARALAFREALMGRPVR
jgi:5-(carboxyamino)imidazole ribonucleotide synthase